MKILKKAPNILDHANDYAIALAGVMIIFMMLSVTADVALRYLFNSPLDWTLDISQILQLYIPFLTAAWVLRNDKHIRIDIIYNSFPVKMRHVLNIANAILGIFIFLFITLYGSEVVINLISTHTLELRLGIPTFAIIIIIPIGSFLLFLQYFKLAFSLISSRVRTSTSETSVGSI